MASRISKGCAAEALKAICRWARQSGALAIDVLALVSLPVVFEILSVGRIARLHPHQNATLLDPAFVVLDALFGDPRANERANDAPCRSACTTPCERSGYGSRNHEAQTRNDHRRPCRRDDARHRAH